MQESHYAKIYIDIGANCYNTQQYEKAIDYFSQAIVLNPQNDNYFNYRGNSKFSLNRYEEAIQDFDKAIQLNPRASLYFHNRGNSKFSLNRYEEATQDFDKAIQLNPKEATYFCSRGVSKRLLGRHEEAIQDFDEAIQLNSKEAIYFDHRGISKFSLSRYEEAIQNFTKAIQLNPKEAAYFNHRGNSKRLLGQHEDAFQDFNKAIQLNPNEANYFNNRGHSKSSLKCHEDAIQDYDRAIQLNSKEANYFYNRGTSKFFLNQYEEAIKDFDESIKLNSKDVFNYRHKAFSYLFQKDLESAQECFKKVLAFTENDSDTISCKNISTIGLSFIDWLSNKQDIIFESFFKETLEKESNNSKAYLIGNILTHLYVTAVKNKWVLQTILIKSYKPVLEMLSNIIEICPQNPRLYYFLAELLLLKGKQNEAIINLNKALKISPRFSLATSLLQTCKTRTVEPLLFEKDTLLSINFSSDKLHHVSQEKILSDFDDLDLTTKSLKNENNNNNSNSNFLPSSSPSLLKEFKEISYTDLELGKVLGKGGFGVVYKGEWQFNAVAIKQLHATDLTEKQVQQFQQEVNFLIQLRHPQIVQFYGACTQEKYAIVMEFCDKGSLFSVLHNPQEKLPWDIRTKIAFDAGKGIYYLHEQKIIHRDIKSLNVLLDNQYNAKITDFGLSMTKFHSSSLTQSKIGTIAWMAPELFKMKVNYSIKSDMYAYGMVLWELAARQLPYAAAEGDQNRIMMFILQGEHDDIPEQTPEGEKTLAKIAHLIKWCWNAKPEERPTAKEALESLKLN